MQDSIRRAPGHVVIALAAVCAGACWQGPRPGTLRQQWQRTNGTLHVRAEIYDEGEIGHR